MDDVKNKKRKFTAENAEVAEQDKECGQDDRMNRIKHASPGSPLLSIPILSNASPLFSAPPASYTSHAPPR
jgi:hypothetical protein